MSTPIAPALTQMPPIFMAGTTVGYQRSLTDYPATSGWTLKVKLNGIGTMDAVTATADGSSFDVLIPATTTALLPGGDYQWVEVVTSSVGTFVAARGVVQVIPNALTATAGQLQGFEEKALAIVEAQILARVQADVSSYSIEQRAAVKLQIEDLQKLRTRLQRAIAAKRHPGRFITNVEVTFGRLSDLNPWPPGRLW